MKDWLKLIGLGVLVIAISGGVAAGLAYLGRKHRDSIDKLRCTCQQAEQPFANLTDHPVDLWLKDLNGIGPARVTLERASKDGGFYQRTFIVETNGTWKEFRP